MNLKYFNNKLSKERDNNPNKSEESTIEFIKQEILIDTDKIWNSIEIYDLYLDYGGENISPSNKNRLMNTIADSLQDKVYLFKSPGVATILMHKNKASSLF